MAPPLIERASDGLRFEPTVQPGMVRCEACLQLVEPAQVEQHKCLDWWNPEGLVQRGEAVNTITGRLDVFVAPNKVIRQHRK